MVEMKQEIISYKFEKVFLRRYLVKSNGEKHLMGVVQEDESEVMEEGGREEYVVRIGRLL